MEGETKLAIIIGCSLGGAALVFILILILVCVCTSRNAKEEAVDGTYTKHSTVVAEDAQGSFSMQKPGLPPVQQSAFIRTGSQQYRGNISLTSTPPNSSSLDKPQRHLHAELRHPDMMETAVNSQPQQHVPWYMRTLGRARQFLLHRPVAYQSKRDSGEQLVEGRYSNNNTAERAAAPNAAYLHNKKAEVQRLDRNTENLPNSNARANAYFNYGSQSALLPNDVIALSSSLDKRHATEAYVTEQSRSIEYRGVLAPSAGNYLRTSNPQQHQPAKQAGVGQVNQAYLGASSSDLLDDASTQMSLPRPTVIKKEEPFTEYPVVKRDRISSLMPPNGKHPTRPDTPTYDPHRKYGGQPSRLQHKDNLAAINPQHQKPVPVSEQQPRPLNQASASPEEKKIGDAFKFLDDLEE